MQTWLEAENQNAEEALKKICRILLEGKLHTFA